MVRGPVALLALLLAGACGGDGAATGPDAGPTPGMVQVPAGWFTMGDPTGASDEQPARSVFIAAFEIDRVEATQAEWQACFEAGVCAPVLCQDSPYWNPEMFPDYPALCMTWSQARTYCEFHGKRLPSEAEWERAARGDGARRFAWGDDAPDCARVNFDDCGNLPDEVDSLPTGAAPFGALHMTGNVREWTADWYAADAYATQPAQDPTGPTDGNERVVRGGGFNTPGDLTGALRAAARDKLNPILGEYDLGVRCAK